MTLRLRARSAAASCAVPVNQTASGSGGGSEGFGGSVARRPTSVYATQIVIRKGYRQHVDSYSAFLKADRKTLTGLTGYLKERGLKSIYFAGLATDFCVAWSALDAKRAGLDAVVIEDATRGIDAGGSLDRAWSDMTKAGVMRIQAAHLLS